MSNNDEPTEPTVTTYYGFYLQLSDEVIEGLKHDKLTAEVVLEYNGQQRMCSFNELVAFMKGESI
jgi:hypothetical protein